MILFAASCTILWSSVHSSLCTVFTRSNLLNLCVTSTAYSSVQSLSHVQLCDPMKCRKPSFPAHHQLPKLAQTNVHRVIDAIQPFHPLSSLSLPAFNFSRHEGLFQKVILHIMWPKYWSFSLSISPSSEHSGLISFRMDSLDLLAVQGTLKSLLQHHSSKASILGHSVFFIVQLSHPYMTTGKIVALTRWTFIGKVMFLYFNMLSRLVISFLPSSKCLLISWLQSPSAVILESPKIKFVTVSPSICHEVIGLDAVIFVF